MIVRVDVNKASETNIGREDGYVAGASDMPSMWEWDATLEGALQKFKDHYGKAFEVMNFANGEKIEFDYHIKF